MFRVCGAFGTMSKLLWVVPKIRGTIFGDPHNKDYSILGSILGSPYLGKLPYTWLPRVRYLQGDYGEVIRVFERLPCKS